MKTSIHTRNAGQSRTRRALVRFTTLHFTSSYPTLPTFGPHRTHTCTWTPKISANDTSISTHLHRTPWNPSRARRRISAVIYQCPSKMAGRLCAVPPSRRRICHQVNPARGIGNTSQARSPFIAAAAAVAAQHPNGRSSRVTSQFLKQPRRLLNTRPTGWQPWTSYLRLTLG